MKLEDQVCSYNQSLRLAKLGVKIETQFYWHPVPTIDGDKIELWPSHMLMVKGHSGVAAPTVAELGVLLENNIYPYRYHVRRMYNENWGCYDNRIYKDDPIFIYAEPKQGENLARAAALIWLIKNKYIDPKTLKL